MRRVICLLFAILTISAAMLAQTRTVKGQVVAGADNEPLVGASVRVPGTQLAVVTDVDGNFTIPNVPESAKTIQVSYVGMTSRELPITSGVMHVALDLNAAVLDEVVVTAMGISRSEKTLGYSATQVDASQIEAAQTTNVMSALQGKVAGLQIQNVSSSPGTASNVNIRGLSSINGNNQPLYVVDGVPMANSSYIAQGQQMSTGGVANISPDDIASLTVLKGAAATALYGSRAANGVIMITTKSGSKGQEKNYTITYSGNVVASRVAMLPEMQDSYGQGWNGQQTYIENGSWGPKLDGSTQVYGPIWNNSQRIHTYDAKKNNVKDFFDTGWSQNHSVAMSGVSKDQTMSYYASYTYTGDNGVMPGDNDTFKRNAFSFRGSFQPEKWIKISSSVNYSSYKTKAVGQYQGTSVIDGLFEFPRDISIVDLKDLNNAFNTPEAYYTPYGITNPYWALANNKYEINGNQTFGKIQADIYPVDHVTLTYRFGFDVSNYDTKQGYPQIDLDDALINEDYGYAPSNMNQAGYVYSYYRRAHEYNHDFMAQYNNKFFDSKFDVTAIVGVNMNERAYTWMNGQTDDLSIYTGFWDLSNGSTLTTLGEGQMKRRLVGLYGDISLGWDEFLYLDVTMRNDWSSTLPKGNRSFFYPGVTLAGIFTRFIQDKSVLSFGKVRLAYGKTGNDADPYYTATSYRQAYSNGYYGNYITNFPVNGTNSFMASATSGSNQLRPEMTTEFEAGLNLKFFNGRIDFDASFYNRVTKDQIFTLPVDPSSGYSYQVCNFGKVRNRGVELALDFIPVQLNNFQWQIGFNWAYNRNKVLTMPESLEGGKVTINSYSAGNDAVYLYAMEGKALGQYYTYLQQYVTDENSPYYGQIIVGSDGLPVLGTKEEDTGMNMNHKWTGGVTTALSAFGFTLSGALDIRYGGYYFCRTKNLMSFTGNGKVTMYNDRQPFVIPNSVVDNGDGTYSPNTKAIYLADSSLQDYYELGWGNGGKFYMVDRTYVKLRNISLTYQLPRKWLKKIYMSDVAITLYGNNLVTWTASDNIFSDPEVSNTSSTSSDLAVGFGQYYANPSQKEFGVNLKVTF
ncbi:MAG: SusC/RagA family TonB-linked outer membrane protein [Bacteroidales bacterium]|nr:SusC/RagA family TonB-linked outer membrane protein [Bacteroidales bacterium]